MLSALRVLQCSRNVLSRTTTLNSPFVPKVLTNLGCNTFPKRCFFNGMNELPQMNFGSLVKPFIFTVSVSCISFAVASIWRYEGFLKKKFRKKRSYIHENYIVRSWQALSPGEKVAAVIITLNSIVYVMWRIPLNVSYRFMMTYFSSHPTGATPCLSLLLSAFSQTSMLHLCANMCVLWSFTPVISNLLGPEQLAATYITAAVVSGFASYVFKVITRNKIGSVGASGAIMAFVGMLCSKHPEARLSIVFVDELIPHSFSAGIAMKALIFMDSVGIILKWKTFDHAGHLAGMVFGLWYINYGTNMIWPKMKFINEKWVLIRNIIFRD